jgi:hypothetical protein
LVTTAVSMHLVVPLTVGSNDGYSERNEIDSCGSHCQTGTFQLGVAMATARGMTLTAVAATDRKWHLPVGCGDGDSKGESGGNGSCGRSSC